MIVRWLNKHSLNFKLSISILSCVCLGFFALVYFISERIAPLMISQIDDSASKSVAEYAKDISYLATDVEQIVTNTKNALNQTKKDDIKSLQMLLNSALKTSNNSAISLIEAWVYTFDADDVSKGILYLSEQSDRESVFKHIKVENLFKIRDKLNLFNFIYINFI